MQLAIDTLNAAFCDYQVKTERRPSGALLLSLCLFDKPVLQRVLPAEQCHSEVHLEWLISAIRRDLALEAGLSPVIANLQSQSRMALPTYS